MRIALPQLNYFTGNPGKNQEIMLQAIQKAQTAGADLIVFPELAICGPFPQDLLEKEEFINECRLCIEKIASACGSMAAIIGGPNLDNQTGIMYNSAYFIQNGEVTDGVHKTVLSDYDIFSESRYFVAGEDNQPIRYKNQNLRILFDEYESEYIEKTDHLIIHIGLSPFTTDSLAERYQIFSSLAKKNARMIISINPTGGCTSVLLDGNSMIFNPKGELLRQLKEFEEDFFLLDTRQLNKTPAIKLFRSNCITCIHKALVHGIRDYFYKHGFTRAILGLSGGIDSAIVAALTAEALGKENVFGLLMPSEYSTDHSIKDARDLAENIGMPYETIPIKPIYESYLQQLHPLFGNLPFNVAEENLQSRIRGMLVMAMSNKLGYIALNTSNKSEAAVGYGTLYGDLCGSLSVIGDVYKTDIYKLAQDINRKKIIIPENTITKAPSAELRPGQKDQDTLPDYPTLDQILRLYIENNLSEEEIIKQGFTAELTRKIINMVEFNNYKRSQCPPVLKVSKKAFGMGRRRPF